MSETTSSGKGKEQASEDAQLLAASSEAERHYRALAESAPLLVWTTWSGTCSPTPCASRPRAGASTCCCGACRAHVSVAKSAAEALQMFERDRPQVLVSDIGMPGEDGYSLIRKVRARPKAQGGDVPAVALTAYAQRSDRTRALMEGFHNHVSKPAEPQELIAVVAAAAGHRGRRAAEE